MLTRHDNHRTDREVEPRRPRAKKVRPRPIKTEVIQIRVTAEQKQRFDEAAVQRGLTLSSWLVTTALERLEVPGK
jgi:hypothetical protein